MSKNKLQFCITGSLAEMGVKTVYLRKTKTDDTKPNSEKVLN